MSRRFVRRAGIFYSALAVAAALWNGLRGRDFSFTGDSILSSLVLGVAAAASTVSLGLLTYRLLSVMRRIADELAPVLVDRTDWASLVLLSIFSGVGEEMFFRGAVQPEFGLVVASVLFGIVHVGPDLSKATKTW